MTWGKRTSAKDAEDARFSRRLANTRLLNAVAALWDQYPDQRFGQLVMNLSRDETGFADTWEWKHGEWWQAIGDAAEEWARASSSAGLAVGESASQGFSEGGIE